MVTSCTITIKNWTGYPGLFDISSSVTTFADAPFIKNLKVKFSGSSTMAYRGGGIVQNEVAFIRVDNCSFLEGTIGNGGGICGGYCGSKGEVIITNCSSAGITSYNGGGICSEHAGSGDKLNGVVVNLVQNGAFINLNDEVEGFLHIN